VFECEVEVLYVEYGAYEPRIERVDIGQSSNDEVEVS
jgi:hypothetical protein